MNRNDLMVGNLVNVIYETTSGQLLEQHTVRCIHLNTCEMENGETFGYNQVKGVNFSHDVLVKLGFEKYMDYFYRIKHKKGFSDGWFLNNSNEITKSISEFYVRVYFVHELQNLYYQLKKCKLVMS